MGKLAGLKQAINKARRVYQGSPHKHKGKLDADKIGTGEGAQAYGYGHYVAENIDTAKSYAPRDFDYEAELSARYNQAIDRGDYEAGEIFERAMMHETPSQIRADALDPESVLYEMQDTALRLADEIQEIPQNSHLYELDLNESAIDTMLDWDAPLSEQPEVLKKLLGQKDYGADINSKINRLAGLDNPGLNVLLQETGAVNKSFSGDKVYRGYDLYQALSKRITDKNASGHLKDLSIPGIKYFDGGSRQTGEGTRNFVIFPGSEGEIKAVSRNGEKLAMLGGILGGSALMPEDSQAATLEAIALQGAGGWKQRRGDKTSKWKSFKESYLQPAATVATALGSMPIQGLAGIGALAQGYGIDDAVGAMESTGEELTYIPDSEAGMESLQNIGEAAEILGNSPPVDFVNKHIDQGADWAADNIHPAAGAFLKTLPEVVF